MKTRTPAMKLALSIVIGFVLMIPLMTVYALVYDREYQSQTATSSIAEGWGNEQRITSPLLVIPFYQQVEYEVEENGKKVKRQSPEKRYVRFAPDDNGMTVSIDTQLRKRSIYESAVYEARVKGKAQFSLPEDLVRYGVTRDELIFEEAQLRIGVSDMRGILANSTMTINGQSLMIRPGNGLSSTSNSGFFAFVDASSLRDAPMKLDYQFGVRGHKSIAITPDAQNTTMAFTSKWPHPGFAGDFLPNKREISEKGFSAEYAVSNLALGRAGVTINGDAGADNAEQFITINFIQPVDLYSQVTRAVKYGILFIGFTFITFLLMDLVGGTEVAMAEYFLSGLALILFFIMLLAFAEIIGFTWAYLVASVAIIGLLGAYSMAILGNKKRAGLVVAVLTGLYAMLYVLLNLEAWSLLIGSVLLFVTLALVMFLTRKVDWSGQRLMENEAA